MGHCPKQRKRPRTGASREAKDLKGGQRHGNREQVGNATGGGGSTRVRAAVLPLLVRDAGNGAGLVIERVDNTRLYHGEQVTEHVSRVLDAVDTLSMLVRKPKGNAFHQLRAFRKNVAILLDHLDSITDLSKATEEIKKEMSGEAAKAQGKRWTDDEDAALVELATKDDETLTSIALSLGRSPSAVQSRLTHLVGIERKVQKIAGKFHGLIDGNWSDAELEGELLHD